MKKYLITIISIMLIAMVLCSCFDGGGGVVPSGDGQQESESAENDDADSADSWDPGDAYIPDEDEVLEGETLEARLPYLERDHWEKKGNVYVFVTKDDDCDGEYTITAAGNTATLTVDFNYSSDNKEMLEFYKDDKEATESVCAYWYLRATDATGITQGSVKYTMMVGGKKAKEGKMTYDEALEAYNSYGAD